LSQQQQAVVDADHLQHRALLAVAGSGKTEVLVQAALRGFQQGKNVLLLTKITSVTEEIKSRLREYDPTVRLVKAAPASAGRYPSCLRLLHLWAMPINHLTSCIASMPGWPWSA
jgi:late competence protein required for DNA uptake (superfamily II DNA/RNA helicase)